MSLVTPLTRNVTADRRPTDFSAYTANGGYRALQQTIGKLSPSETLQIIKDSNLRGRGGAGFPTGMKWSFVPMEDATPGPKYLICNADEMEPGTFKDRLLMECDPHQLIEGMILAAYTIQADVAYIFIRAEYHLAALHRSLYLRRGNCTDQLTGRQTRKSAGKTPLPASQRSLGSPHHCQ